MDLSDLRATLFLLLISVNVRLNYGAIHNSNKWAVLVAGSSQWFNYRHQADVCHAYQVLRSNGVPEANIITMIYDDIANNPSNPYPGVIYNHPNGSNVYKGVKKDYTGDDITPENFMNILLGNDKQMKGIGSGKVLKSGPDDHVFIFYTDHGNVGIIGFPQGVVMTYHELLKTLDGMQEKKLYGKMLFYMEACYSGSMFQKLPNNKNIFATTAANAQQSSYACYCDEMDNLPCLGDKYSVSWIENTESVDVSKTTINAQYETVKKLVNTSDVQKFGQKDLGLLMIGEFFGSRQSSFRERKQEQNTDHGITYPSHEVDLHYLHKQLNDSTPGSAEEKRIVKDIHKKLTAMKHVKQRTKHIAMMLAPTGVHLDEILTAKYEPKREHGDCFDSAVHTLLNECFTTDLHKEYAFQHTQMLVNLCSQPRLSADTITNAIKSVCEAFKHEKASLEKTEECWMGSNLCNVMCSANGKRNGEELFGKCVDKDCICFN